MTCTSAHTFLCFTHWSRFPFTYTDLNFTDMVDIPRTCFCNVWKHVFPPQLFKAFFQGKHLLARSDLLHSANTGKLYRRRYFFSFHFFFEMHDYWSSQFTEGGVSKHGVLGQKHLFQDSPSCFSTVEWPYKQSQGLLYCSIDAHGSQLSNSPHCVFLCI